MNSLLEKKFAAADCEVAFDNLTASSMRAMLRFIKSSGAASPFRAVRRRRSIINTAVDAGVSIIPRGAGSGLSGGAIGDGLIVDFSRFNREISGLDLEKRSVGAGVVLDQLNAYLRPHGFCFGLDVATSSR